MSEPNPNTEIGRIATGIPGMDAILPGGIPELSINILAGPPGVGKTIFSQQILYHNATPKNKALYMVTVSEPSVKLLHHLQRFNFYEREKVGNAVIYIDIGDLIRKRGLEATLEAIVGYVQKHQPGLVVVDSFKAIDDVIRDPVAVREFGYDFSVKLAAWGVTALLLGEYTHSEIESQPIFAIADGVFRFHYQNQGLYYQRFIDILKMRGESYQSGMHPFTIASTGVRVYPRLQIPRTRAVDRTFGRRTTSGLPELDRMLSGGIPNGTSTLLTGGAGTGKTLMGLTFIAQGIATGEPGAIFTFQENLEQLREIALGFGWDLGAMEDDDQLALEYNSPVEIQPDIFAARLLETVRDLKATRVLIDSANDLEIATGAEGDRLRFRNFLYALLGQLKQQGVTTFLTNEIAELFGSFQLSEHGTSFVVDNVILLRYVELAGRIGRAMNVMKVRGSQHSKDIRAFEIGDAGITVGETIEARTGVLTGMPVLGDRPLGALELPGTGSVLMETLAARGPATFAQLQQLTQLDPDTLQQELNDLVQQGRALARDRDGQTVYKATSF